MVDTHADERGVGVQLVGKDAEPMAAAAREICGSRHLSWLNLNCGCPSAHTMGSGGGSALLDQPDTICDMVRALRENAPGSVEISVKIRVLPDTDRTLSLCKRIEEAGADFLIIHGRTPSQGYSGKADWELIRKAKDGSEIPIVGNGDILCSSEGRKRVEDGFCDAFMIGRAAMGNPLCFSDKEPQGREERTALLEEYARLSEIYLKRVDLKGLKLKAMNFFSCIPGACAYRNEIAKAKTAEEIMSLGD